MASSSQRSSSRHCVLIGGLSRIGCVPSIDDHVVNLARKKTFSRVRALHIGVCNGDAQKDEIEFDDTYKKRGCEVSHTRLWNDPERARNIQFTEQDIIYVSGGTPHAPIVYERMVPEELSLRRRIQEAYDAGVIIVGNSAGAILLGRCHVHGEGLPEASTIHRMFNILDNVACFAHFEEYIASFSDEQGESVPPEEFLRAVHHTIKKKSRTNNLYTLGLWENSALAISWSAKEGVQMCTAQSIGHRDIMYMNRNSSPESIGRT